MDAAQPAVTDKTLSAPKSPWSSLGNALFIGEGNLSFVLSVARSPNIAFSKITATTFEKEKSLSEEAIQNANALRQMGVAVNYDVDATHLDKIYPRDTFDTIVFQFPNVGSREPIYGRNANYVLMRRFLKNATECLKTDGKVIISAVDSPYYRGAFQFDEAAKHAGFKEPVVYPFDPAKFPGYNHTNTNDDASALEKHDQFSTWVFTLKG